MTGYRQGNICLIFSRDERPSFFTRYVQTSCWVQPISCVVNTSAYFPGSKTADMCHSLTLLLQYCTGPSIWLISQNIKCRHSAFSHTDGGYVLDLYFHGSPSQNVCVRLENCTLVGATPNLRNDKNTVNCLLVLTECRSEHTF